MIPYADTYSQIEQRFSDWSFSQPAIAAVIVVGSRARSEHSADEWSDLDLVVFASDTTSYLSDSAWLNAFGTVIAAVSNSFGQRDREWIVLYTDGSKLDVAFLSIDRVVTPTLQDMLDAFPYPNVLQRGVRVLIDKTGSPVELRLPKIDAPKLPNQAEFTALINRAWLDAVKAAKFIRRNDLWRAKQLCDSELKQQLLTLLEWHAAVRQDGRDIWYDGRFLNEWADREALADLPGTFAAYSAEDLQRALLATLALFRRLANDTASRLGYAYPADTDQDVTARLESILRGNA
jgi:aminoglycoside 6-adenylyltransferase